MTGLLPPARRTGPSAESLRCLLSPRSVALVGASDNPASFGGKLTLNLLASSLDAAYLVNPRRQAVAGIRTYPTVEELPAVPDCLVVATPAESAVEHLRAAADRGVRAAILVAGGFAESGEEGARLQDQLERLAAENDMAVLGPNCIGAMNVPARLFLTSKDGADKTPAGGPIALIAQSGSLAIVASSSSKPLFRHVITTGNEAVVSMTALLDHLVATDEETDVFALVVESISDRDGFSAAADRIRAAGRHLVLLKTATGTAAAKMAALHTGAVAGAQGPLEAFCREHHIRLVHDLRDFTAALALLGSTTYRSGRRVGVYTPSGGSAVLCADFAEKHGLILPSPSAQVVATLTRTLDLPAARITNPLDTTGFAGSDSEVFGRGLREFASDDYDLVLVPLGGAAGNNAVQRIDAVADAAGASATPVAAVWQQEARSDDPAFSRLAELGVPTFTDYEGPLRVMALMSGTPEHSRHQQDPAPGAEPATVTDFVEVLHSLERTGVRVAAVARIDPAAPLEEQLEGLPPFPFALKVSHPRLVHKSDSGLVRYPIRTAEEAARAVADMVEKARGLGLEGATIVAQEGVAGGFELLCGFGHDVEVGPFLVLAAGGIYTEILSDSTTISLASLDQLPDRVAQGLRRLRCWEILDGARGRPPLDVAAAVHSITGLAAFFLHLDGGSSRAMEVNPLVVLPAGDGVRVLDVRVV